VGVYASPTQNNNKKQLNFYMWVDIAGSKFNTDAIACVRPVDSDSDSDDDQCVIFTTGQSAIDAGFLVDLPIEEVFSILQNCRMIELAELMISESDTEPEPEPTD